MKVLLAQLRELELGEGGLGSATAAELFDLEAALLFALAEVRRVTWQSCPACRGEAWRLAPSGRVACGTCGRTTGVPVGPVPEGAVFTYTEGPRLSVRLTTPGTDGVRGLEKGMAG